MKFVAEAAIFIFNIIWVITNPITGIAQNTCSTSSGFYVSVSDVLNIGFAATQTIRIRTGSSPGIPCSEPVAKN